MPDLLITARLEATSAAPQDRAGKPGNDAVISPFATLLGDKMNKQAAKPETGPIQEPTARPLKESTARPDATPSAPTPEATAGNAAAAGTSATDKTGAGAADSGAVVVDLLAQVLAAAGNPIAAVAVETVAKAMKTEPHTEGTDDAAPANSASLVNGDPLGFMPVTDPAVLAAASTAVPVSVSITPTSAVTQANTPLSAAAEAGLASAVNGSTPGLTPLAVVAANAAESGGSGFQPHDEPSANGDFAQLLAHAHTEGGIGQTVSSHANTQRVENGVLQHPAGEVRWQNELGDKLVWMASAQRQHADLVLNPPQLGRIEVSLSVSGDQANAVFASPNAAVREMLENSLPRLREIMSGAGIELGDAQINSGSSQQNNTAGGEQRRNEFRPLLADAEQPALRLADTPKARVFTGRGLVDTFV